MKSEQRDEMRAGAMETHWHYEAAERNKSTNISIAQTPINVRCKAVKS